MAITTVLFDLDGTLLPMDQNTFANAYFKGLAKKMAPHGYEPQAFINAIWSGVGAMVKNDGSQTNEDAFWKSFVAVFGSGALRDTPYFEEYYRTDFQEVQQVCGYNPNAAKVVSALKRAGLHVALATNPLFPVIATQSRIRWAGLAPEDFELYTTYENARFCKPNPAYYQEIMEKLGVGPDECLMVGNDVSEDMIAATLGMRVFLLTDYLINTHYEDISTYPNGGFAELFAFLEHEHIL